MIFSLDYDGTASEDIELWTQFVKNAKARGHTVYIVTMRTPAEAVEIPAVLADEVEAVICTSRDAKRPFCRDLDIEIDVWIDDQPLSVSHHARDVYAYCAPIAGEVETD
jgi:hypothetical protein